MKFSIDKKVNLFTISVIIIMAVFLSLFFIKHETQALNLELNERAIVLLNCLKTSCEYPILIKDKTTISRLVKSILTQKDVVFCKIENIDGKLLFEDGSKRNKPIIEFKSIVVSKRVTEEIDEDIILGDSNREEDEIGKIYLAVSLTGLNQKIKDINRTVILFTIIAIIFAYISISLLLKYILSKPITLLVKGTERIAKGDLDYKVSVKSSDEIGILASSFNKMTEDLQKITVSRDYFDDILSSMHDTLIVVSEDGIIQTVNISTCSLLGYNENELIGQPISKICEEPKFSLINYLKKKSYISNIEKYYLSKDGRKVPMLFSAGIMRGKDDKIQGIVCAAHDITKRKQMEEKLLENEKRYRTMIENANDMIWTLDTKGNFTFFNRQSELITGYKLENWIGKSFASLIHQDDFEIVKEVFKETFSGKPSHYIVRIYNKNGEIIILSVNTASIFEKSRIIGTVSFGRDITEQKKAEENLQFLSSITKQVTDAIIVTNTNFEIIYVNKATEELYDYSQEELLGKKPNILNAEEMNEQIQNDIYQTVSSGKVWLGSHLNRRKDGSCFFCEFKISCLRNRQDEISSYIAIQRDITERKHAEDQIKASLVEKNLMLQEINHRVKNNLQIICSMLKMQSRSIEDEHLLEIFRDSQNRVKSMAIIHQKLYDDKDFANVNFEKYIKSLTLNLMSSYKINRNIIKLNIEIKNVLLNINASIPCGLILNELISNALKYAFPENRKGEITIKFNVENDIYSLIVSDNGIGFPQEINFMNPNSIGLKLIHILILQLQGTIELDKTKGTKFIIIFKRLK
ncbi:MAG: PAS domain S-box protein [Candidatus Cloacimonetes bacterium]|nr:PAS domain S-box protein [Candidatus Cloacimonadota bacterium]